MKVGNSKVKKEIRQYLEQFTLDYLVQAGKQLDRHFVVHCGPTNSGKTYQSIQRLKEAKKGVYLGPLRLLALEVFDTMNEAGKPCSLLTGEERTDVPFSGLTASTIEMCDYSEEYDVAVIDECQMLGDESRGGVWLQAILTINAHEVHLCTAPEALHLIQDLLKRLDAPYTVVKHERLTPLIYSGEMADIKDARPGDALITFSRKGVLSIAASLERYGIKASVIYGALPPQARREEVRRFKAGETTVVVATDAIGMGISLPIRRVIFCQTQKFDGTANRDLTNGEILQIAGRAGRFGKFEKGEVLTMDTMHADVKKALKGKASIVRKVCLPFPTEALSSPYPLDSLLSVWNSIPQDDLTRRADMSEPAELLYQMRLSNLKLSSVSKQTIYSYICCPVQTNDYGLVAYWVSCCKALFNKKALPEPDMEGDTLESCERQYRAFDIQHQMGRRAGIEIDNLEERERLCKKINGLLKESKNGFLRKCSSCGRILPANHPYGMCEKCYQRRWGYSHYWEDDDDEDEEDEDDFDDEDEDDIDDEDDDDEDKYKESRDEEELIIQSMLSMEIPEISEGIHREDWVCPNPPLEPDESPYPILDDESSLEDFIEDCGEKYRSDLQRFLKENAAPFFLDYLAGIADDIKKGIQIIEWYDDGCPWDHSGDVRRTSKVFRLSDRWKDVLENCTGNWIATFMSGHGKRYITFKDILEEELNDFFYKCAEKVLEAYLARYESKLSLADEGRYYYNGEYEIGDILADLTDYDQELEFYEMFPMYNCDSTLQSIVDLAEKLKDVPVVYPDFTFSDGWTPNKNG